MNLLAAILGTTPAYFRSPTPELMPEPLVPSVRTMSTSPYLVAIPSMAPSSIPVYDLYSTLPPHPYSNKRLDVNKISQFTKTYDKENKYTGDPYDLIDDKMRIFLNLCYYMDIQLGQFYALFSRILTKQAETFYTYYVGTQCDIYQAYMNVQIYFDTEVNYSHYYTDWTTMSFTKVCTENSDKDLHTVLQLMLDKMRLCQRALGSQYIGEDTLKMAVIRACRDVPSLEIALFRPAKICVELFVNLRSSIETFLSHVALVYLHDNVNSIHYLDR